MSQPPRLTDRAQLIRNRRRADPDALFLHREAADEIQDRLQMVNKTFTKPAIITGFPDFWANFLPGAKIVTDDEVLGLTPGAHDLVIQALTLHWADNPVMQLFQALQALEPDGFFIGVTLGGATLSGLRDALARAETDVTGGLSPRILPMAEIRDMGDAMQRAGFALPVVDSSSRTVSYKDTWALMRDLRAMGEGNAMAQRLRRPTRRAVFEQAAQIHAREHSGDDGRVLAEFEMLFLSGWSPHESQQKPLRPGSAQVSLAKVLGSD